MVLGFGAGLLLAAMAQAQGGEAAPDVVAAYFAIWNGGSVDDLDDVVTADFRRHAGPGERVESREELARLLDRRPPLIEELGVEVDDEIRAAEVEDRQRRAAEYHLGRGAQ